MKNTFQGCAARIVLSIPLAAFLYSPSAALASVLGSAQSFAVLGGASVTSTGTTTITGDLGVSPGSAFTPGVGFTQTGTIYLAGAVALSAETDATIAYNALAAMAFNTNLTGQDLGGMTLAPGVYFFSSSAGLTGTLTLDASSDPNGMFVFQIGSTLTTGSNSAVNVINGGSGIGVFWQIGSSATLGTGTSFAGNILALTSIGLNTSATICGRALARNGAVTLDTNTISDSCPALPGGLNNGQGDFNSLGFAGIDTPEPGTVPLFCVGLLALALYGWQSRKRVA